MANPNEKPVGSHLLLDEYFAGENPAFVNELIAITSSQKLAGFVNKWTKDPRPWAWAQVREYLKHPMTTPGHNVVVKRLFKHAEKTRDTALMAVFLHRFDTLVRRKRRMRWTWDRVTREASQFEVLYAPKDILVQPKPNAKEAVNPKTLARIRVPAGSKRIPKNGKLFSHRTRYYLRRRAWRYFRKLGHQSPSAYLDAAALILQEYVDDDFTRGENILDSWCVMHLCYRQHPALSFTAHHVRLNEGRSLNELSPSPKFPELWKDPAKAQMIWDIVCKAPSRLVRVWGIQVLREHHDAFLKAISPEKLLPLFDHDDDEMQQFAADLFANMRGVESLPIDVWLRLLGTRNPEALAAICSQMTRHVTPERLDLAQIISLATAAPTPVATLGHQFLKSRSIGTPEQRLMLSDLAASRCVAVARGNTEYALGILGSTANYDVRLVTRFFDALMPVIRAAAWDWLTPTSAGFNDPALWACLLETPYEDVRLRLVTELEARAGLPGDSVDRLVPVWTAVLLGIHRGGRHKIKALHQISRTLVDHPDRAAVLLPVVAVAIRSVRPAEARVGLASVVQAIESNPSLAPAASVAIPELVFVSEGATA